MSSDKPLRTSEFRMFADYEDFAQFVKTKSRYVMDSQRQAFLDAVVRTARARMLPANSELWRAQIGHRIEYADLPSGGNPLMRIPSRIPLEPERMMPLLDRAYEGRVNPKGIPCLYCSDDKKTAMTEVRPWIGSTVSVARFLTLKDLRLVDFSDTSVPDFELDKKPIIESIDKNVLWTVNLAFAEPITRADDVADYAPTQVIAEVFRNAGWDGIIYDSKLGTGKNFALFDVASAKCRSCELYEVRAINLEFLRVHC